MLIEIFTKNFWVAFSFFLAKTDLLHLLWITMMSWNFDRLFAKDSSKYPFSPFQHWYFCNLNYSEFRFIASIWKKVHVCVDIFHKRNGIWCFVVVFKETELLSKLPNNLSIDTCSESIAKLYHSMFGSAK